MSRRDKAREGGVASHVSADGTVTQDASKAEVIGRDRLEQEADDELLKDREA